MFLLSVAFAGEPAPAPSSPPASAPADPAATSTSPSAPSPDTVRWETDTRRQVSVRWNSCVENLPSSVQLPAPSYTTVASIDVAADGAPDAIRIVTASGSEALDNCALQAFRDAGKFPVPPATMIGRDGKAHLAEVTLTVNLGHAPAPPPAPAQKATEAQRVTGVTAADVAAKATRIATVGSRNIWCGGTGDALRCNVRDAGGHVVVTSISACRRDADLYFTAATGPMVVRGGAELVPDAPGCP